MVAFNAPSHGQLGSSRRGYQRNRGRTSDFATEALLVKRQKWEYYGYRVREKYICLSSGGYPITLSSGCPAACVVDRLAYLLYLCVCSEIFPQHQASIVILCSLRLTQMSESLLPKGLLLRVVLDHSRARRMYPQGLFAYEGSWTRQPCPQGMKSSIVVVSDALRSPLSGLRGLRAPGSVSSLLAFCNSVSIDT